MEDPQSSIALASQYFDNGQIKDAYNAFLSTAQYAIQPLFDVKFVHSTIVSKPQNTAALLSILHTCVDHIEKIMEHHSPSAPASKISPPPLPPKPSKVSKPVLPSKPSNIKTSTSPIPTPTTTSTAAMPIKRSLSNKDKNHTLSQDAEHKEIADGEIDPTNLVPAQTSNNDSLTPTGSFSGIKTDHIPNIPVPPLLTTHRVLESKLAELESSLKDYRARKQQLSRGEEQAFNYQMTENEINEAISKYTPYVAEAKHTLNRVRTLYMNAGTIPSILHFPPGLVAYQITRIESAIFLAIPSHALLSHAPKTPHPRVIASTDFFNYITRLIEHSVLLPQDASVRAQHINHWIKIASKCQDFNNYQTLKAVVSALGTPPVQRLKRTWAFIPKKSLSKLDAMNELMSESNNYGKYREHMGIVSTSVLNGKSVNLIQSEHFKRPTVPFLGTFIHDMTYLLAAVGQQNQKSEISNSHIPVRSSSRNYHGSSQPQHQDPRINKLLDIMCKFQSTPPYERKPNVVNAKMMQKNQNQGRPSISQAIHRSKSSFGRLGGAIGFGNGNTSTEGNTGNEYSVNFDAFNDDDFDAEEQQSLVTHYLLMRSWVSQNTVDELSLLREPPTKIHRSASGRTSSMGSHYSSSIMSNTSSLMRINSSHSPATNSTLTFSSSPYDSRPASLDDYQFNRSYVYGRGSANTAALTSSSTLEDDDDLDDVIPTPPHLSTWNLNDPALMYNKAGAPLVPPRPTTTAVSPLYKGAQQRNV